jgi:tryptophan synthase beta subunit
VYSARPCSRSHACRLAPQLSRDAIVLVNLSGRGDKDVLSVQAALEGGR